MDWNGNNLRVPLVSRPDNSAFSFLYNYNYDQFSGLEMKQASMQNAMVPTTTDKNNTSMMSMMYGQDPKKKRLSTEQLESLENSFQEEIKLDPDRKMKLAKELGLQPRQIAVWFQNKRARWKGKQLERLYDALKQEYDAVSRDKHKLQQELDLMKNMLDMTFMKVRHIFITWEAIKVLALRAMLKEQVVNKQVSTGYTEVSGEETVESTSIPNSDKAHGITTTSINNVNQIIMGESSYALNVDDYTSVMMTPYNWA